MIYVILKDGRTIRYNKCCSYIWDSNGNRLNLNEKTDGNNIASIKLDYVERVEFQKPCAIHDKNGKLTKIKY